LKLAQLGAYAALAELDAQPAPEPVPQPELPPPLPVTVIESNPEGIADRLGFA